MLEILWALIPPSPFSRMSPNHLIPTHSWSSRPSHLPQTNSWLSVASTPISPNTIPTIAPQTRAGRWALSGWNLMLCSSNPNVATGPLLAFSNQENCSDVFLLVLLGNCAWLKNNNHVWCFVLCRTPSDTTSLSTATFWKWPALRTSLERGVSGVWILLRRANWWNKPSGKDGSEGWLASGRHSDLSPPGEWVTCVLSGTGGTLPDC